MAIVPLGLAALLFCGCSRATTPPVNVQARADTAQVVARLRKVVVVPAEFSKHAMRLDEESPENQATEGGTALPPGKIPAEPTAARKVVTELVVNAAARHGGWELVDAERVAPLLGRVGEQSLAARAGRAAALAGADAALAIYVDRFRERDGSDFGVRRPASVALALLLVPAGGTEPVWRADYAYTQEPLTYNLWNVWGVLRGGPKWLRAAEIARIGIDEAIARLRGGSAAS
ncbi:MAG: hypothetical protein QOD06_2206 [Candidatus Binatota bacterium]|nr:hypothetical protein [Candidatus Binatota bacterium]